MSWKKKLMTSRVEIFFGFRVFDVMIYIDLLHFKLQKRHGFGSFLVFFWSEVALNNCSLLYTEFFCLDLCDDLWNMA